MPGGFPAYVRIFHPAYRRAGAGLAPVRWAEIAAANGTRAHAGMQLGALTGCYRYEETAQPGVFDAPPRNGMLEPELAAPLAATLAHHTASGDSCWFAVWNGWGGIRSDVPRAPTFAVPSREFHLLAGPVEAAVENLGEWPGQQSPNLWWPDDRAWCVATEIDFKTTYIGCSEACSDEILATELEAFPIDPDYGIDWRSDLVNSFA